MAKWVATEEIKIVIIKIVIIKIVSRLLCYPASCTFNMHENICHGKMIVKNRTKNLAKFHPNKCHKSEIRYAFDCRDETSGPSN